MKKEQYTVKDSLFGRVFDSIPNQIYVLDDINRVLMLNRAAVGFVSLPQKHILGKRLDAIAIESTKLEFFRNMLTLSISRVPRSFSCVYGSAGQRLSFEVHICQFLKNIMLMITDVTAKQPAELEQSSNGILFKSLLEQVRDSVVICDSEGRISWANEAAKKLHRIDPVGSSFNEIPKVWGEAFDSENRRTPREQWSLPQALRGIAVDEEWHLVRPDKSTVDLHVTAAPIKQVDGKIVAAVSIARDITERKQTEKAREALYAEERRLLKESRKQSERMEQFVSALIHELKTPLTPMLGASAMLVDKLEDEGLKRLAMNISRGAQNLSRRLDDLIDLMKGEMGILHIKYETMQVKEMLDQIKEYVTPEAERKQLIVSLEMPDFMPTIRADEDRLGQVIFNLLNNAMKFTPPGGYIAVKVRTTPTELIIEVCDTGCGIARKNQDRLFEPYQLLANDNNRAALGIGLPLSKMLVELHGGRIWAKSRKGRGSTFSFSIPLKVNRNRPDGGPKTT